MLGSGQIRKISAVILTVLFLFVHIEKAFHSHQAVSHANTDRNSIQNATRCNICEFQLTRDAGLPVIFIENLQYPTVTSEYSFYECIVHTFYSEILSDRGPPALL
jgi:hypothetical protein